ncbi:MAG: carbohydrate ABC transporter permease [Oscillospiraceae bacterium]|nr:carbohydrate ABC transporter permease [Oscillospiraceae bacterium]
MTSNAKKILGALVYWLFAGIIAVMVCIPFFWMVSTSLKSRGALMSIPMEWLPKEPTLDAYQKLFEIPFFAKSIFNSLYMAVTCTVAQLLFASMAAFALTKIRFKGQNAVFSLYITALMIPVQITFIPIFIILTRMNLTNNLNTFILFHLFNAFAIFMLRQRMMTIHNAMVEAALIDGAGWWRIFFQIIMPLCGGALATLAILSFMSVWNDYLLPLVLLSDRAKATLPIILSGLSGQYQNQFNLMMAGALVSIIPILILYVCVQGQFKEGMTVGSVKG